MRIKIANRQIKWKNRFGRDLKSIEAYEIQKANQYAYEEDFEAPLSLSNLEFWEEAFNLSVSIA